MMMTGLHFSLMFLVILKGHTQMAAFVKFTNNVDFIGFNCPEMVTRFEGDKISKMQCLSLCADSSSCFGVFHDQESLHCVGCGDKFLTNKSAPLRKGMLYYQRQTYVVVSEVMSWNESKLNCEGLGGYLADIKSEEEQMFIENHFSSIYPNRVWIGAVRMGNGGPFYWEDDTPFAGSYTNWESGQPNNYNGIQNCVLVNWNEPWKWHDIACNLTMMSLCEFD